MTLLCFEVVDPDLIRVRNSRKELGFVLQDPTDGSWRACIPVGDDLWMAKDSWRGTLLAAGDLLGMDASMARAQAAVEDLVRSA